MVAGFEGLLANDVWYRLTFEGSDVANWKRALKNTIF
jgi:hypothetical protein